MGGESLLHPQFKELLNIVAGYKKKYKNFPVVALLSNGCPLTKDKAESIIKSGAIDIFKVSIDGGNKEKYEWFRIGANWENVISNTEYFIELNNKFGHKVKTGISTLKLDRKNIDPRFLKLSKDVDYFLPTRTHNFDGSIDLGIINNKDSLDVRSCRHLNDSLIIFWDGRASTCCADINGRIIIGDINNDTIKQVWMGKKRRMMINTMKRYGRKNMPNCKECNMGKEFQVKLYTTRANQERLERLERK